MVPIGGLAAFANRLLKTWAMNVCRKYGIGQSSNKQPAEVLHLAFGNLAHEPASNIDQPLLIYSS